MADKDTITEQFYSQVSESIKMVFDLTSRIDERVKMLVERQNELDERLERFIEMQQALLHRVTVLESKDVSGVKGELADLNKRLAVMESAAVPQDKDIDAMKQKLQLLELKTESLLMKTTNHENRWSKAFDFVLKVGWALLTGYLLYKLGFPEPMN